LGCGGGGWRPDGGRSLFSYFVTGCVRQFAQVYAKWEKQQIEAEEWVRVSRSGVDGEEDADVVAQQPCPRPGPEPLAVLQDEAARALDLMPEELRKIMRHRIWDDLTQRQAAEKVAVTPSAAQNRLVAWRRQHVRPDPGDGLYGKEIY
jgi:DNA-directed RNA polymerase specialized sigma24 family protein